MFDCKTCSDSDKKDRGCKGPVNEKDFPDGVWTTDFCLYCFGENPECPQCMGNNRTKVWRCPRAMSRSASYLLPYFFDHYAGVRNGNPGIWPDGRGRYYQPIKLVRAFQLLLMVMDEKEKTDCA